MSTGMLHLHSLLRYLILIVALWAIIKAFSGMKGGKTYTKSDQRPGLLFLIFMDLQLLIGLYLYFVGPWFNAWSQGGVMSNKLLRFFSMEHGLGMIIALILVHIGYAATKKAGLSDQNKFKKSFWMYLIALIIIFASIPWPFRAELGRGWMPGM